MVQAIRFEKTGGPDVLVWQKISVGKPGPGQVRLHRTISPIHLRRARSRCWMTCLSG